MMPLFIRHVTVRFAMCLATAIATCTVLSAQELLKDSTKSTTPATEPSVSERVRLLESELERQNAKLDQLQITIADQQLAIKALLDKITVDKPAALAESITSPSSPVSTSAASQNATQAPTVEQRLAKVEGQALKIGPLKVSGDFRLRFDGIFRSATDPTDPSVAHVQNSRARYRFRINFDNDLYPTLSFHAQLGTGPANNPLTGDQDFGSITARHPFFINEAWIDYHPTKELQFVGGRVQEVFADNSRFMFDDDVRFNGFNEKYVKTLKKNAGYFSSVDFRAGQYILSNPNVAIVTVGSPLARAGEIVGSTGRSANMFHQGVLINQTFNQKWSDQVGADVQLYRHPNQIQLASTADGVVLLVQPGLGISLSGPLSGTGNATTTAGGAMYTAPSFKIGRLTYKLSYSGFRKGEHMFPVTFNLQLARNLGISLKERDAMLAALQIGNVVKRGDTSFLYVFTIKGANALISQLTDDDLGTGSGVNIRASHFRFEYGIARKVKFQSLFFVQNAIRNSGQYPSFFVPVSAFVPTTYRVQQQIVFTF
jgi:hypothetical protein